MLFRSRQLADREGSTAGLAGARPLCLAELPAPLADPIRPAGRVPAVLVVLVVPAVVVVTAVVVVPAVVVVTAVVVTGRRGLVTCSPFPIGRCCHALILRLGRGAWKSSRRGAPGWAAMRGQADNSLDEARAGWATVNGVDGT